MNNCSSSCLTKMTCLRSTGCFCCKPRVSCIHPTLYLRSQKERFLDVINSSFGSYALTIHLRPISIIPVNFQSYGIELANQAVKWSSLVARSLQAIDYMCAQVLRFHTEALQGSTKPVAFIYRSFERHADCAIELLIKCTRVRNHACKIFFRD